MKEKVLKTISIVISSILIAISTICLFLGLSSIGAPGLEGIGVIFILPALLAIGVNVVDLLITIGKIKKGFIYSIIISIIKIVLVLLLIPSLSDNITYERIYGYSNMGFVLILMAIFFFMAVPSGLNILRLKKGNK